MSQSALPDLLKSKAQTTVQIPVQTKIAKVFKNGASQAVRLPATFRFDTSEVFATRDEQTGNVILSTKPIHNDWQSFFDDKLELDKEGEAFMSKRPMNAVSGNKSIFE